MDEAHGTLVFAKRRDVYYSCTITMTSFFTFRSSSTSAAGRAVIGVFLLGLGWMGSAIIQFAFNPVDYITMQYTQVLLYEWLPMTKPVFVSLVPMIFLALMEVFQHTSWKRLLLVTVTVGIVLTIPAYVYNLKRWQPLVRTIQDLPLREVKYYRHTGTLGAPAGMGIKFIIPKESFTLVKQEIETRVTTNRNELLKYRLEGDHPLTANYFFVNETTDEDIEVNLYVRPAFRGYDY